MAEVVYILCAGTSLLCAYLLIRSYARQRSRLLLWSAICFLGFAMNNALLFVDLVVLPQHDLSTLRILPAFLGLMALLYGLIWESR